MAALGSNASFAAPVAHDCPVEAPFSNEHFGDVRPDGASPDQDGISGIGAAKSGHGRCELCVEFCVYRSRQQRDRSKNGLILRRQRYRANKAAGTSNARSVLVKASEANANGADALLCDKRQVINAAGLAGVRITHRHLEDDRELRPKAERIPFVDAGPALDLGGRSGGSSPSGRNRSVPVL